MSTEKCIPVKLFVNFQSLGKGRKKILKLAGRQIDDFGYIKGIEEIRTINIMTIITTVTMLKLAIQQRINICS